MKTVPARLLILLACVLAPVGHEPSDAEEPDSAWARTATVDQIVDKIRLDEEWIWDSDSFYLEASGEWKITPEGIRFRLAELKTQFPDTDFDDPRAASQNMGLLPLVRENLLLAWDKNRIAKKDHKIEFSLDHRYFDGERVLIHEHFYHKDQEHYAIVQDRQRYISETAFANYSIGRLTWPNTWWSSSERGTAGANRYLSHVEDKGIQIRDGKAYRVLSSGRQATSRRELWIDAENGRLSYIRHLRMPNPMKAAMKWFTSTQDSEHPNPFELTPSSEFLLDDWRQVSPGKWFPFKQGHTAWLREKEDAGKVSCRRTVQFVKLQVNEPLPEHLFQMNLKDGADVHDLTHDPPLHYKHKKEFTKKQWDAILAEAMEENKRRKSVNDRQQAMIGKRAPRLHTEKWIPG
jgi:hypothetical protein